jgi:LPXTG-motif cell wall-anchored protein
MSVDQKETVNVPVWAGVGAILVGAGLLLVGSRKT